VRGGDDVDVDIGVDGDAESGAGADTDRDEDDSATGGVRLSGRLNEESCGERSAR